MEDEPTTGESGSADANQTDDFDLSAEDNAQNNQDDLAGEQPGKDAEKLPSDNEPEGDKPAGDKAPAFDDDLEEWAEKAGHDKPENDRERKLLQNLRNSSREFTRDRQAKKTVDDLQKTVKDVSPTLEDDDVADPLEKDVQTLKADLRAERTLRMRSEYFGANDVTPEESDAMGEILKEKVDRAASPQAKQQAIDFWTDPDNLGDWHDLAKIRLSKSNTDGASEIEKAKQEERERLAKQTKSASTQRSAKSTVAASKKNELQELWESDD